MERHGWLPIPPHRAYSAVGTVHDVQLSTAHTVASRVPVNAGTALGTGLQRLVALVGEVEGGRLSLAALHMEHPLLGTTALQQQIQSHYLRAALPEIVKLVGSANVLGAPLPCVHAAFLRQAFLK